jgi:ribonuclease G
MAARQLSKEPRNQGPINMSDSTQTGLSEPETKESSNSNASRGDNDSELKNPPREQAGEAVPPEKLRQDARQRARKRPVMQRVVQALKREERPFRELIINSEPLEKRVALLSEGVLEKFEVERAGEERMVGAVFKGKIQNLEPGLKAAFVDIGQPKNAFLHYWDILPSANDSSVEFVRDTRSEGQKQKQKDKVSLKDIPKLYPIGTDIMVQVTKAQIGSKGPRTTTNIALPGRFIVLMPFSGQCGISRKIEDRKERDRLKKIIRSLTIPEGMGIVIRTAGEGKKIRYFVRDLHLLLQTWNEIQRQANGTRKPALVYREPDIVERTVRDFLTEDIDRVLIDNEEDQKRMMDTVAKISSRSRGKISFFREDIPIFERYNIERQIEQTFQRKVPLPSGGEIVIEETEALTAIDVNTGSHKGSSKDGKNYILQANLEAASESARQIRLRNIGGLIILDFIDMKNPKDRKAVYNRMRKEMELDKAKSHVLPISQLGIMQMTRQRHSESNISGIYSPCPYCSGRGIVKGARTMSVEIQRRAVSVIRHLRHVHPELANETVRLRVLLHPVNLERLRSEDETHLVDIEKAYNVKLSFRADPAYHVENFKIINADTGEEMR